MMNPRLGNYTLLLILNKTELTLKKYIIGIKDEAVLNDFAVYYERCFRLTGSCMPGVAMSCGMTLQ